MPSFERHLTEESGMIWTNSQILRISMMVEQEWGRPIPVRSTAGARNSTNKKGVMTHPNLSIDEDIYRGPIIPFIIYNDHRGSSWTILYLCQVTFFQSGRKSVLQLINVDLWFSGLWQMKAIEQNTNIARILENHCKWFVNRNSWVTVVKCTGNVVFLNNMCLALTVYWHLILDLRKCPF